MANNKKEQFIDIGRVESEKFEPTEEVRSEFDEIVGLNFMARVRQQIQNSPA
jgi:ribosome-binding protein aMBF1 (putative translation factor)